MPATRATSAAEADYSLSFRAAINAEAIAKKTMDPMKPGLGDPDKWEAAAKAAETAAKAALSLSAAEGREARHVQAMGMEEYAKKTEKLCKSYDSIRELAGVTISPKALRFSPTSSAESPM